MTEYSSKKQRHTRLFSFVKLSFLFIVIPTLLASIYYTFVATEFYQSEAQFVIQSADSHQAPIESIFGQSTGSILTRDALVAQEYMRSREVFERLEKDVSFREMVQDKNIDFLSRLSSDASFDEAYFYFKKLLNIKFDNNSGLVSVSIKASDPKKAQVVLQHILKYTEEMVNTMSLRVRRDQLKLAEVEVGLSEKRTSEARKSLVAWQGKNVDFDPQQSAVNIFTIKANLEDKLSQTRAGLSELKAYMQPNAPQIVALENRIQSLMDQIEEENQRLVSQDNQSLNKSILGFEDIASEKEFAQKSYLSALSFLENARIELMRQHRYLSVISKPSLSDQANYPKKVKSIFTVFAMASCFLIIGALMLATIREHARF